MAIIKNQHGVVETKEQTGRPTKWKPEINEAIVKFFERAEPYREHFDAKGHMQAIPARLPFLEDFAASIGVTHDTLLEWAKPENEEKYPGFSVSFTRAKQLQKRQIIEGAMVGAYNPQFSMFLAKNITDMHDKQEHEHTGKDGAPLFLPTTILDKNELKDAPSSLS